jgi:3-dehydroquinate synthase
MPAKTDEITIHVNAGAGYDAVVAGGVLSRAGALAAGVTSSRRAVIVTDSNVGALYGGRVRRSFLDAGFSAPLYSFPAGEPSKNHSTLLGIYSFFASSELTRSDTVVALGGGVAGDTAGFAAATWQRGVNLIQIPTTLLAQVDASVGGKTAVDLPEGKNLVGAFWQPKLVLCDPEALATLDSANLACGMAEVIKHGAIKSAELFSALGRRDPDCLPDAALIAANIDIKRGVVERDERESGERMLLNFGHTLGHAIEKLKNFSGVTHGECVAMGMAAVTRASERRGLTAPGTSVKLEAMLRRYTLPVDSDLPLADIVRAARGDKKRAGENINLVYLHEIGRAGIIRIPVAELAGFFGV